MEVIECVIVDDEGSARDILENLLLNFCDGVRVMAKCENLEKSVEAIREYKPDVVFLDIEMPRFAGFEIARFFDEMSFDIVFVTAYDKYALKAFEVSALDYLLKPIDIDRLIETVERIKKSAKDKSSLEQFNILQESIKSQKIVKIPVIHQGYRFFLDLSEIIAFEAQGSYCKIYLKTGESHLVSKKIKYYEELLGDSGDFFRSHKSWIVNFNYIKNYSKANQEIQLENDITAKLSRYRTVEFEQALEIN